MTETEGVTVTCSGRWQLNLSCGYEMTDQRSKESSVKRAALRDPLGTRTPPTRTHHSAVSGVNISADDISYLVIIT